MDNTAYEHELKHYNNNTKDAEVGFSMINSGEILLFLNVSMIGYKRNPPE